MNGPAPSQQGWDYTREMTATPPPAWAVPATAPAPAPPGRGAKFWVPITLLGVLLLFVVAAGGFVGGRETRLSDTEVNAKLANQASHDASVYATRQRKALERQAGDLRKAFKARLKRDTATAAATGQSQGYSSGQSAGFNSGKAKGQQEGKGEGYVEGYDDGYDQGKSDGYDEAVNEAP